MTRTKFASHIDQSLSTSSSLTAGVPSHEQKYIESNRHNSQENPSNQTASRFLFGEMRRSSPKAASSQAISPLLAPVALASASSSRHVRSNQPDNTSSDSEGHDEEQQRVTSRARNAWTDEEVELLLALVAELSPPRTPGEEGWKIIGGRIKTHTPNSCLEKFRALEKLMGNDPRMIQVAAAYAQKKKDRLEESSRNNTSSSSSSKKLRVSKATKVTDEDSLHQNGRDNGRGEHGNGLPTVSTIIPRLHPGAILPHHGMSASSIIGQSHMIHPFAQGEDRTRQRNALIGTASVPTLEAHDQEDTSRLSPTTRVKTIIQFLTDHLTAVRTECAELKRESQISGASEELEVSDQLLKRLKKAVKDFESL